jgi:hypothetical protein
MIFTIIGVTIYMLFVMFLTEIFYRKNSGSRIDKEGKQDE